jgi:putative hydrolase of the HAD superfamily
MSGREIELFVLDAHGVVLNNPLPRFLDRLAERTGQERDAVRERWHRDLRTPAWTGRIGDEELWELLAGAEHATHDWRAVLERSYEPGPAAPYLARWSARVPLWLLSNHRSHWLEPRLRRFGLHRAFERILVSDRIGAAKPEAGAFAPILEHVRSPSSVLFLDDRMRNVEAARALGLRAVRLTEADAWLPAVDRRLSALTKA